MIALSPEDTRIRGARAQQLLEDPVLTEAFAAVETDAIDGVASAKVFDADELAHHAAMLQAVRAVRQSLRSLVTSGLAARGRSARD